MLIAFVNANAAEITDRGRELAHARTAAGKTPSLQHAAAVHDAALSACAIAMVDVITHHTVQGRPSNAGRPRKT